VWLGHTARLTPSIASQTIGKMCRLFSREPLPNRCTLVVHHRHAEILEDRENLRTVFLE
jgi:hypothetical protein